MARHYKNWIKAYMDYTRAAESPDNFHRWVGVSAVAGALRRRVWIEQNIFQWTPNFYIILVAPPGIVGKSTTTRLGMALLEKVPKVTFGPDSMTWQALTIALTEAADSVQWTDKDGIKNSMEHSCLTIELSELGTFLKMQDDGLVSVLIDLYDGKIKPWKHSTRGDGTIEIQNPWINLVGCTTPTWLQTNFPEAMIGGGLTSRVIFVYGDQKRHLSAYPSQLVTSKEVLEMRKKLTEDLISISTLSGEYILSSEAMAWGIEWYEKHWASVPSHMASSRYEGYRSRKQTHMHKVAMVLAASKRSKMIIELEDLTEAETFLTLAEADMIKVFSSIGMVSEAQQVQEILSYVSSYKFITLRNLWKLCHTTMPSKQFEEGVKVAVENGLLRVVKIDNVEGIIPGAKTPEAVLPT